MRNDFDEALGLDQLSLEQQTSLEAGKRPERKVGIIVTNHHLYWPPNAMYERIRQGWIMRQQLLQFKGKHTFPAFMCGGKCADHSLTHNRPIPISRTFYSRLQ